MPVRLHRISVACIDTCRSARKVSACTARLTLSADMRQFAESLGIDYPRGFAGTDAVSSTGSESDYLPCRIRQLSYGQVRLSAGVHSRMCASGGTNGTAFPSRLLIAGMDGDQ